MTPAQAMAHADGCLPLSKAIGRIAVSAVCVYPPGIYVLRPGQVIDEVTARYVERILADQTSFTVQGLIDDKVGVTCGPSKTELLNR